MQRTYTITTVNPAGEFSESRKRVTGFTAADCESEIMRVIDALADAAESGTRYVNAYYRNTAIYCRWLYLERKQAAAASESEFASESYTVWRCGICQREHVNSGVHAGSRTCQTCGQTETAIDSETEPAADATERYVAGGLACQQAQADSGSDVAALSAALADFVERNRWLANIAALSASETGEPEPEPEPLAAGAFALSLTACDTSSGVSTTYGLATYASESIARDAFANWALSLASGRPASESLADYPVLDFGNVASYWQLSLENIASGSVLAATDFGTLAEPESLPRLCRVSESESDAVERKLESSDFWLLWDSETGSETASGSRWHEVAVSSKTDASLPISLAYGTDRDTALFLALSGLCEIESLEPEYLAKLASQHAADSLEPQELAITGEIETDSNAGLAYRVLETGSETACYCDAGIAGGLTCFPCQRVWLAAARRNAARAANLAAETEHESWPLAYSLAYDNFSLADVLADDYASNARECLACLESPCQCEKVASVSDTRLCLADRWLDSQILAAGTARDAAEREYVARLETLASTGSDTARIKALGSGFRWLDSKREYQRLCYLASQRDSRDF